MTEPDDADICRDSSACAVTVTLKLHELVFPLLSRTVQLTVVTPAGKVEPLLGVQVTLVTAQLSLTAGAGQATTWLQASVALVTKLPGQAIVGGWVSSTVTVNVQVLE